MKIAFIKVSFIILFLVGFHAELSAVKLADLVCSSGFVLPFFVENNERFVILGREGHGCDRGMFGDFGGRIDRCDVDSIAAGAREFHEEAILRLTVPQFSSLNAVKDYIDPAKDNTKDILAYKTRPRHGSDQAKHMITFIVDFTNYKDSLLKNYANAIKDKSLLRHEKEKNALAIVSWNALKDLLTERSHGRLHINGKVLQPDGSLVEQSIPLRAILTSKLRKFIKGEASLPNEENKMHLSEQGSKEKVEECTKDATQE